MMDMKGARDFPCALAQILSEGPSLLDRLLRRPVWTGFKTAQPGSNVIVSAPGRPQSCRANAHRMLGAHPGTTWRCGVVGARGHH